MTWSYMAFAVTLPHSPLKASYTPSWPPIILAPHGGAPVPSDAEMRAECASDLRLSPEELPEGALQKWAELWGLAAAAPALHRVDVAHVATGPTRAGFDHDKVTKWGPHVSTGLLRRALDHTP